MATQIIKPAPANERKPVVLILSLCLLAGMYALLFLTQTEQYSPDSLMQRCVLMDPNLSRIWSVANVEIGVAYFSVFGAMAFYLITMRRQQGQHLNDLRLAFAYLICSFILDYFCVQLLKPFPALLVGDAIVMTFTLMVSRELWFQRLLGVFVPLIFFTCGMGHALEGISYWHMTYKLNVPWSMVTADIGFAVLVNAARFPAFIRGADIQDDIEKARVAAETQHALFRDVLYSVTDGKLRFHLKESELPNQLDEQVRIDHLDEKNLSATRKTIARVAESMGFSPARTDLLITASGEALMNAIVHGKGGEVVVRTSEDEIQVWVKDNGHGIPIEDLPNATLQKGWSSSGTMGIGFPLMLSTSDSVDILTSNDGTRVVITMYAKPEEAVQFPFLIDPSAD